MELVSDLEKLNYQRGWDHIFGKYQGTIYLVPTEAETIIFQYSPEVTISCILPAKERNLLIEFPKGDSVNSFRANLKTPDLVLSQFFYDSCVSCTKRLYPSIECYCKLCCKTDRKHPFLCFCSLCYKNRNRYNNAYKLQYFNRSSGVYHWSFANVSGGDICFGNQKIASNLRQANANFWGSAFNNSNNVATNYHTSQKCSKTIHAFLSSQHHEFLNHRNKACRRNIKHICQCDCSDKISHHPFNCKGCSCKCQCQCCLKQCNCICNCSCCRNTCACVCKCNLRQAFFEFLVKISHKCGEAVWPDSGKTYLFGTSYLQSSQYCEGVFISYLDSTISKVNTKPLVDRNGIPFIAGFARQIPDNEWEVRFDDSVYLFSDKEVHIPK